MTAFADTPCGAWEPVWCGSIPTGSEAVSGSMLEAATEALWALSGRRFGLCTLTIRPCRQDCLTSFVGGDPWLGWGTFAGSGGGGPLPALIDGAWYNLTCGNCPDSCSCSTISEALLPAPVASIVEVKVDGVALPTGSYRVDDYRKLVRTDGGVWPLCNDLSEADTEPGTWSVTLQVGEEIPQLGKLAVGELAIEFMRACAGEDCRLPRNVQQLARQGVTISYPDPNELLDNDKLGLFFGDRFLNAYNPNRLRSRSRVYRIDDPGYRQAGT